METCMAPSFTALTGTDYTIVDKHPFALKCKMTR